MAVCCTAMEKEGDVPIPLVVAVCASPLFCSDKLNTLQLNIPQALCSRCVLSLVSRGRLHWPVTAFRGHFQSELTRTSCRTRTVWHELWWEGGASRTNRSEQTSRSERALTSTSYQDGLAVLCDRC